MGPSPGEPTELFFGVWLVCFAFILCSVAWYLFFKRRAPRRFLRKVANELGLKLGQPGQLVGKFDGIHVTVTVASAHEWEGNPITGYRGKDVTITRITAKHLDNGHGYMCASTWLQCPPPSGPNNRPGGDGTKEAPGIRWWLEFVLDKYGPYVPPAPVVRKKR